MLFKSYINTKSDYEVEAVQLTNENKKSVLTIISSQQMNIFHDFQDDEPVIKIPKDRDKFDVCSFGDYIVKMEFSNDWKKFYVIKKENFEKDYVLLDTNKEIKDFSENLIDALSEHVPRKYLENKD